MLGGLCLFYKRLDRGTFRLPSTVPPNATSIALSERELDDLLDERALKTIATGRKAWLFCGSDDHTRSTAALFSIVASARLHRLDVE